MHEMRTIDAPDASSNLDSGRANHAGRAAELLSRWPQHALIGGEWIGAVGSATLAVLNPCDRSPIAALPSCTAHDVDLAIDRASAAWGTWRSFSPSQRGDILRRWGAAIVECTVDLAPVLTLEQGKPLAESHDELAYAASFAGWFAAEGERAYGETIPSHLPGRRLWTAREPIGVVAAILPWNCPTAMFTRKACAALAAGCPVIVVPSVKAPLGVLALASLAVASGLPRGVLSVVTGDSRAIVQQLCADDRIRALSFTGSTAVGTSVLQAAAGGVKKVSLELGGLAPFIVGEGADPDLGSDLALSAKFYSAGQDCLAASRILVHQSLYVDFLERFSSKVSSLVVDDGFEPEVDIGPLIDEAALEKCERHVADAANHGARILTGGLRHDRGPTFFSPTVLADVREPMLIVREETFGPVAGVRSYSSREELIELANAGNYGLAGYVVSPDLAHALWIADQLEVGMVAINGVKMTGPPVPFGGVKRSGLGREGSHYGLEEFTQLKYVCIAS